MVAWSLLLYSIKYLSDTVKASCRTLHHDLKDVEVWVMAQRLLFLKKEAAKNPLADHSPRCPFIHPILGGTHKPKEFEDYRDSVLQSSTRSTEGDQEDVEITAEIPAPNDGIITIRCRWEDLLDYHDHQNQLGCRTTVKQRIASTKEFFQNKLGSNSQVPTVMDKEGSKAATRNRKLLSSGAASGLVPGHGYDKKR